MLCQLLEEKMQVTPVLLGIGAAYENVPSRLDLECLCCTRRNSNRPNSVITAVFCTSAAAKVSDCTHVLSQPSRKSLYLSMRGEVLEAWYGVPVMCCDFVLASVVTAWGPGTYQIQRPFCACLSTLLISLGA